MYSMGAVPLAATAIPMTADQIEAAAKQIADAVLSDQASPEAVDLFMKIWFVRDRQIVAKRAIEMGADPEGVKASLAEASVSPGPMAPSGPRPTPRPGTSPPFVPEPMPIPAPIVVPTPAASSNTKWIAAAILAGFVFVGIMIARKGRTRGEA